MFGVHERRVALKQHAEGVRRGMGERTCSAFAEIARFSGAQHGTFFGVGPMLEDLKLVIVGEGFREGRGEGEYFCGNFMGAADFKPQFRDDYNQVQHAMAGIYLSWSYGYPARYYLRDQETEPQDLALYEAAFSIARDLGFRPSNLQPLILARLHV